MKKIEENNTLVFICDVKANKRQIKEALKKLYDVDCVKVNTLIRYVASPRPIFRIVGTAYDPTVGSLEARNIGLIVRKQTRWNEKGIRQVDARRGRAGHCGDEAVDSLELAGKAGIRDFKHSAERTRWNQNSFFPIGICTSVRCHIPFTAQLFSRQPWIIPRPFNNCTRVESYLYLLFNSLSSAQHLRIRRNQKPEGRATSLISSLRNKHLPHPSTFPHSTLPLPHPPHQPQLCLPPRNILPKTQTLHLPPHPLQMLQHRRIRLQKPLHAIRRAALFLPAHLPAGYPARDAFRPADVC